MRSVVAVACLSLIGGTASAQTPSPLDGSWTVDLSTDPSKPYTKIMTLALKADGSVGGLFYDSEIQAGRWKTDRGRTCVSFRTTDGQGLTTPEHAYAVIRWKVRLGPSTAPSCSTGWQQGGRRSPRQPMAHKKLHLPTKDCASCRPAAGVAGSAVSARRRSGNGARFRLDRQQ
jgi:hypothetical protein